MKEGVKRGTNETMKTNNEKWFESWRTSAAVCSCVSVKESRHLETNGKQFKYKSKETYGMYDV